MAFEIRWATTGDHVAILAINAQSVSGVSVLEAAKLVSPTVDGCRSRFARSRRPF